MAPKSFTHVSSLEHDAMRRMHDGGSGVKTIAKAMGRSTDTVSKHLFKNNTAKKVKGRPKHAIRTPKGFPAAERAFKKLLKSSGSTKEVSADMLKAEMKLDCNVKTVRRAFAENGYQFHPLYEKPDLSDDDKKARLAWVREHKHRSPTQWSQYIHACMDKKVFQVLPNAKYRKVAAMRAIRGVYRKRKRDYSVGHVKPSNPKVRGRHKSETAPRPPDVARPAANGVLRFGLSPGAEAEFGPGVRGHRVRHWGRQSVDVAPGGRQVECENRRANVFGAAPGSPEEGLSVRAGQVPRHGGQRPHRLQVSFGHGASPSCPGDPRHAGSADPRCRSILESRRPSSSDRTGPSAEAAKKSAGIHTLDLPKRSPDLMPLDFAFWKNLNKRMRVQERDWPDSKRETRSQYLARLRRTALATPAQFIHSIMGGMQKRCRLCEEAKGGHFPEGGGK